MASGTSSQVMTVDNLEETAIALPTPEMYPRPPAYNNGSGVFRNSWRLNPESFETQKKTEAQIQGLHRRLPRHFNTGAKDGIVDFYRRQNQLVENFQEIEQLIRRTDPSMNTPSDTALHGNNSKSEQRRARRESFALRISFYANACLLIIKVFAAYSSGSLASLHLLSTHFWT